MKCLKKGQCTIKQEYLTMVDFHQRSIRMIAFVNYAFKFSKQSQGSFQQFKNGIYKWVKRFYREGLPYACAPWVIHEYILGSTEGSQTNIQATNLHCTISAIIR